MFEKGTKNMETSVLDGDLVSHVDKARMFLSQDFFGLSSYKVPYPPAHAKSLFGNIILNIIPSNHFKMLIHRITLKIVGRIFIK